MRAESVYILPVKLNGAQILTTEVISSSTSKLVPDTQTPRQVGTLSEVIREGMVLVNDTNDFNNYPFLSTSGNSFVRKKGVQAIAGIKLSAGNELLGVMYVNFNQPRKFNKLECRYLARLGGYASLALKNERIVALSSSRSGELAALSSVLHEIGESDEKKMRLLLKLVSVSYTHLTLPTICSV